LILLTLNSTDTILLDYINKNSPTIPIIVLLKEEDEDLEELVLEKGARDVLIETELNTSFLERSLWHAFKLYPLSHYQRNQMLINQVGLGIVFVDKNEIFLYANAATKEILGVPEEEQLVGRSMGEFLEPEQFEIVKEQSVHRSNGQKGTYELEIKNRESRKRTFLATSCPWLDDSGNHMGSFGIIREITDDIESRKKMLLLRKALETMHVGVTITNIKREIIYINPAEAEMHGYSVDEILNNESRVFGLKQRWRPLTVADLKKMESWERESVNKRKDGTIFPVHLISDVVNDNKGEPFGIVTCCMDITERKKMEEELTLYATTDTMTGVQNRRTGMLILEKKLHLTRRARATLVICFVDIDDLKTVNDVFGHRAGDELIRTVSTLLKNALRQSDTICRLGGDEFLLIFPNCSLEEARKIWIRITKKCTYLNSSKNHPYNISLSHGFAEFQPGDSISVDDLVGVADNEMYKEKVKNKNSSKRF
ncbi:MAG: diguanylate cyclase, partial [bacterium]|nr:diguanylate cyclase [bacterium]